MTKPDSLNTIKDAGAAAVEAVMAAKSAAQDMARSVSSRLDEMKSQSAETLHAGATTVRAAAGRGAAAMTDAGESVAGRLDAASSYVDGYEVPSVTGTLQRAVARHPAATLILAAAVGFCAGRALTRARTPRHES
jgi:streptogramin lyase